MLQKLKVPEGKLDVVVFDEKLSGFGIRKFAKGHASYIVKYSIRGRSKKHTLGRVVAGNLQAMRLEASAILAKAHQGIDAVAEVKAAAEVAARLKTMGELVEPYLKLRETGDQKWEPLGAKTLADHTRYLNKSWLPLHSIPVEHITRDMVEKG